MENKKNSKFLKWCFIFSGSLFAITFVFAFLNWSLQPSTEIKSWKDWVKHRELMQSFSQNVALSRDASRLYKTADDYFKDGFFQRCNLDACPQYRAYIKKAREVSQDGFLSPSERTELAKIQYQLDATIIEKDKMFATKFSPLTAK